MRLGRFVRRSRRRPAGRDLWGCAIPVVERAVCPPGMVFEDPAAARLGDVTISKRPGCVDLVRSDRASLVLIRQWYS